MGTAVCGCLDECVSACVVAVMHVGVGVVVCGGVGGAVHVGVGVVVCGGMGGIVHVGVGVVVCGGVGGIVHVGVGVAVCGGVGGIVHVGVGVVVCGGVGGIVHVGVGVDVCGGVGVNLATSVLNFTLNAIFFWVFLSFLLCCISNYIISSIEENDLCTSNPSVTAYRLSSR